MWGSSSSKACCNRHHPEQQRRQQVRRRSSFSPALNGPPSYAAKAEGGPGRSAAHSIRRPALWSGGPERPLTATLATATMSLHDRLSRIKQTHRIQLEQSDGCLDIRSSSDVVPYQHGSFITTRSASRANSRHHEIMQKLQWLTEAPLPQIGPLSDATNIPQPAPSNNGTSGVAEDTPSSSGDGRSSAPTRELRRSSSGGAGSKRSHPSSAREESPSRKRAAVAAAEKLDRTSPPLLRSSRRGSTDAGRSALLESGEVVEARDCDRGRSASAKPQLARDSCPAPSSKRRDSDLHCRELYSPRKSSARGSSPRRSSSRSSPARRDSDAPRNSTPRMRRESSSRDTPSRSSRSATATEERAKSTSSRPTSSRARVPSTSPSASPSSGTERSPPLPSDLLTSSADPSGEFLRLAKKHEAKFEAKKAEGTHTKREADSCTTQEKRAMFYLTAGLKYLEAIAVLEEAVIAYRTVVAEKYTKTARSKKNELSQKIIVLYSTTAKFFGDCAGLILQPLKSRHTKAMATALNNTASLCYLCQSVSLMRRVYSLRHRLASTRVDWLKSVKGSSKEPAKKEQVNFLTDTGDALTGMEAWEQARKLRTIGTLPSIMDFVAAPSIADMIKHVQHDDGYAT